MATIEQRDKRIAVRSTRLEKIEPRLAAVTETLSAFDEKAAERKAKLVAAVESFDAKTATRREKLSDRHGKLDARAAKLRNEVEWLKSMPIDGQLYIETDDDAADDDGDESDDPISDEHDGPVADEPRQRDAQGHFLPVGANA